MIFVLEVHLHDIATVLLEPLFISHQLVQTYDANPQVEGNADFHQGHKEEQYGDNLDGKNII